MNRATHLLVAIGLLAPATAMAGIVDLSLVHPSQASFKNVPTWSDADIQTQFAAMRDTRYLQDNLHPDPSPRRISWLYPEDGCEMRAELAASMAGDAGKTRPYKLFAFAVAQNGDGLLRVYTPNATDGIVRWPWHVAPVVRNSAGNAIVLDPAIEPYRPLPWQEWLATMVDDMGSYNLPNSGVVVASSYAYDNMSDTKAGAESCKRDQALGDEEDQYLGLEWDLQGSLGRTPSVVLGPSPPWGAGIETFNRYTSLTVPANTSASATASCPFATLAVGGGLMLSSNKLLVYKNARNGNGWEIDAKNTGSGSETLTSSTVCLTGAPVNASVSTVTSSKITIAKGDHNSTTATCSSGVLVGGGFLTTVAGSPSSIMRIFLNGRTSSTSSSWNVSAYNTTTSNRDVTSYAYCLKNSRFSLSQTSGSLSAEGMAVASCPSPQLALGGGFVFSRTQAYTVETMDNQGSAYGVDISPAPAQGDSSADAYAECLKLP